MVVILTSFFEPYSEKRTKLEWKWERFLSVNSKMRCTQETVVKWELAQYSSLHTQKKSWIKLSEFLQIRWGFFFILTKSQKWEPKNASFEGSKKAPSEEVFWALETSFLRFRQNKKNIIQMVNNFLITKEGGGCNIPKPWSCEEGGGAWMTLLPLACWSRLINKAYSEWMFEFLVPFRM